MTGTLRGFLSGKGLASGGQGLRPYDPGMASGGRGYSPRTLGDSGMPRP
ncbi:hypothetical protein [Micromonospora sp. NPDC047187]